MASLAQHRLSRVTTQGDETIGYDNGSYGSSGAAIAALLGFYAIIFGISVVLAILSYVLLAIGLSALFRKTGIEPWKGWVPFYSTYTWLRLGGQNGHWMWLSFVPGARIVCSVFLYVGMYRTGKAFGKEGGFLVLGIFLPWVWLLMLGYGKDEYRPELIAAAGLSGPLEGYGAVAPGTPPGYPQAPYGQQPGYTQPGYTQPGYTQPGYTQPDYPQGYAQPAAAEPGHPQPGSPEIPPTTAPPAPTPPAPTPPAPTPPVAPPQ